LQWYAGSAVTNAFALAQTGDGRRSLNLYEQQPETRQVLRSVLQAVPVFSNGMQLRVPPSSENEKEFDGERHVEENISTWNRGDA
jgi:hypothetical protein